MPEDITDANDCIVKIGERQGGGTKGRLVISSFDIDVTNNRTRQYGIGNRDAIGRTNGNREIDLSFTHVGEGGAESKADLLTEIRASNFEVVLAAPNNDYAVKNVDGDYTLSVDEEEFTLDFDGNGLSFEVRE
jgi:hypothetical protein